MTPDALAPFVGEMRSWRRHLHAHPELAYAEHATSDLVAAKLAAWGWEVHRGLGGTGVLGVLRRPGSGPAILLRADMDALPIAEQGDPPWRSTVPGVMHACGHDGHVAMLLGAAAWMAAHADSLRHDVLVIFQPAEEMEGGAARVIADGLFERFGEIGGVFGLHNRPSLPLGRIATGAGAKLAAADLFEVTITGRGTHASAPHLGADSAQAAASVAQALSGLAAREHDPLTPLVVTVTTILADGGWNAVPSRAVLRGTVRAFDERLRDHAERRLAEIAAGGASLHGCTAEARYLRGYPALVNDGAATRFGQRVAAGVVGEDSVDLNAPQLMGSDDFAFYLQHRPGSYLWLGTGRGDGTDAPLHNPAFDFNDAALEIGAALLASLAIGWLGHFPQRHPRI